MRTLFRVTRSLPHLGLVPGDVLVFDPGGAHLYLRYQVITPDPGAVMAAEQAGDLVPLSDPPPAVVLRLVPGGVGSRGQVHPRAAAGGPPEAA